MKYFAIFILLVPATVFAATPTNFKEVVELFLKILQNFIQIGIVAIILGILYAVALYMLNSDNDQKREQIKGYLVYAVIGLTVVAGLWGIVEILTMTIFGGGFGIPKLTPP